MLQVMMVLDHLAMHLSAPLVLERYKFFRGIAIAWCAYRARLLSFCAAACAVVGQSPLVHAAATAIIKISRKVRSGLLGAMDMSQSK